MTAYGLKKYWINTHTTEKRKDKYFVLQLDNSDSLIDTKFHCAILWQSTPTTPCCPWHLLTPPNAPWHPPVQHWGNHNWRPWSSVVITSMLNWGVSGGIREHQGALGGIGRCQGQQGVVGVDCHRMAQWNFVSINESLLSNCSTKHLSFLFSVVCVLIHYLFSPYVMKCSRFYCYFNLESK